MSERSLLQPALTTLFHVRPRSWLDSMLLPTLLTFSIKFLILITSTADRTPLGLVRWNVILVAAEARTLATIAIAGATYSTPLGIRQQDFG